MLTFIIIGIVIIAVVILLLTGYKKAPPSEALLISSPFSHPIKDAQGNVIGTSKIKVVPGGGAKIVIPYLEKAYRLSLSTMQVDIDTSEYIPTKDYIGVKVNAVANVKISSKPEYLLLAAEQFSTKRIDEIRDMVKQILEGTIRSGMGGLSVEDLVQNREKFANQCVTSAEEDLQKMGMEIINLTIQSFTDNNEVLKNLAVKNSAEIKKEADVARAQAEKESRIKQSQAERESKEIELANQVAVEEKTKEKDVQIAGYHRESAIAKAQSDVAYDIEKEEQNKALVSKQQEVEIIKAQKEVELKQQEIRIRENEYMADIGKKAEADKAKAEFDADAKLYASQKEAEGIRAIGEAKAAAIEKEALAMRKMTGPSVVKMVIEKLPEMVEAAAKPMEKVDSITMYGNGNETKMVQDVTGAASQIFNAVKDGTGLDLKDLISSCLSGEVLDDLEDTPPAPGVSSEKKVQPEAAAEPKKAQPAPAPEEPVETLTPDLDEISTLDALRQMAKDVQKYDSERKNK